jgi:FtsH-binding integral membrane protein
MNADNYQVEGPYIKQEDDLEMNKAEDIHDRLRMGFIRKVYGILAIQLLITSAFTTLTFEKSFRDFFAFNIGIFYVCSFLTLIIVFSLICFRGLARTVPANYILLMLFTICESYMVATISAFNPPEIVITAALMTATIVIALTLYAFTTKTDFTFFGGFLFMFTAIMLFWGLFIMIFGFFLYTLYCVMGVILFGIYLIFDTQLILGKFGLEYSIDDYIIAALNIYIDIIQMFLYILQLLRRDN